MIGNTRFAKYKGLYKDIDVKLDYEPYFDRKDTLYKNFRKKESKRRLRQQMKNKKYFE